MSKRNSPEGDPTVPVSTRLDPQVKHDLECLAKQVDRPFSNYLRQVLMAHWEAERGKKGGKPPPK